uniref:beta-N-acetylhexosaminidase n=1 Tax=Povalibacter sp. TaxID=1962978 RepID=UPI002C2D0BED
MRQQNKFIAFASCVLLLLIGGCDRSRPDAVAVSAPTPAIIPAPRDLTTGAGQFNVSAATPITFAADSDAASVADYFSDLIHRTRGLQLHTQAGEADKSIHFELTAGGSAGQEDYSLTLSPERIVVSAGNSRGLFYGAVTLWQLMTPGDAAQTIAVPAVTIHDSPRFAWRGLMLDSARHFQSPEFVKRFIDWMALHKLNVLHWHLVDDQGWRLEIRKYPKLTSVGAWRVPAGAAAAADIDPATGKPRLYGGYYTQADVREIVAYAGQRHITIVPEIEMPGHASAAVAAYPQLGVTGTHPPVVPADWGVYSTLFNVDDATFGFMEDVLTEVMALFPGEYIHVGGDEAVKDEWEASPKIQAQMRKLGIKDEHALQSYFIHRIEKFLNRHGRRLIGWDEILEGGLAPNATVMSWRGIDGAVAAATAGHDAVLAPQPALYFDNRQNGPNDPSPGRGWIISLEDVYRFDPAPAALQPEQLKHILGLQAPIFTEHMRTEERVEYMTFPRAAALAEVAWSPAERRDWTDFQARLPAQLHRYDSLGIHYTPPAPSSAQRGGGAQERAGIPQRGERVGEGAASRRTSHQLEMCTSKLVLSLTDDAPLHGERAVFLVDIMNPCWILKGADLSQSTTLTAAVGQVPFNFQIGNDVKAIPLLKPQTPEGELEVRLDSCEGEKLATL